jgi:hypothetical protein
VSEEDLSGRVSVFPVGLQSNLEHLLRHLGTRTEKGHVAFNDIP